LIVPLLVQRRQTTIDSRTKAEADVAIGHTYTVPIVFSVCAASAVVMGQWLVDARESLLWMFLLPCLVWHALAVATMRGIGRPVLAGCLDGWGRFLVATVALLAVMNIAHRGLDSSDALLIGAVASAFAGLVGMAAGFSPIARLVSAEPKKYSPASKFVQRSSPFMISALGLAVLTTSDIIVAGFLLPLADVGYYKVAVQLSVVLVISTTVLGAAFSERFAHMWQPGSETVVLVLVRRLRALTFAIAIVVAVPMAMLGEHVIRILFGSEYLEALPILIILLIYRVIDSYFGPIISVLNSVGQQHYVSIVMLQSALLAVVLQIALSLTLGVVGLALGTALAGIVVKSRLWLEWRRMNCGRSLSVGN
jgi:O-antigen/teichoic acid export membrane protein